MKCVIVNLFRVVTLFYVKICRRMSLMATHLSGLLEPRPLLFRISVDKSVFASYVLYCCCKSIQYCTVYLIFITLITCTMLATICMYLGQIWDLSFLSQSAGFLHCSTPYDSPRREAISYCLFCTHLGLL